MTTDTNKWLPPITKWYNVNKETYAIILQEGKERLNDILSESESITNKAYKMITSLAAFLGFFIGLLFQEKWSVEYFLILFIFIAADATLLFILIAPKYVKWRGLAPKTIIPKDLDADEDKEYQAELVYYTSIVVLQENIDYMLDKNKVRADLYKWALILFLILFVVTATFIVVLL